MAVRERGGGGRERGRERERVVGGRFAEAAADGDMGPLGTRTSKVDVGVPFGGLQPRRR